MTRTVLAFAATIATALLIAACGDSEESTSSSSSTSTETESTSTESSTTTEATTDGSCSAVETVEVEMAGDHFDKDFAADDYATNPPTGGDHNPNPIQTGQFYDEPPRLGESVHALEHGAVIGWTNDLSPDEMATIEQTFNASYGKGYFQLAVVENPDLDVPFALSSWGALQKCETPDAAAITSFIEEHYAPAETAEGGLACTGKASKLPACANREG